jgi:hypothetical protein
VTIKKNIKNTTASLNRKLTELKEMPQEPQWLKQAVHLKVTAKTLTINALLSVVAVMELVTFVLLANLLIGLLALLYAMGGESND